MCTQVARSFGTGPECGDTLTSSNMVSCLSVCASLEDASGAAGVLAGASSSPCSPSPSHDACTQGFAKASPLQMCPECNISSDGNPHRSRFARCTVTSVDLLHRYAGKFRTSAWTRLGRIAEHPAIPDDQLVKSSVLSSSALKPSAG